MKVLQEKEEILIWEFRPTVPAPEWRVVTDWSGFAVAPALREWRESDP